MNKRTFEEMLKISIPSIDNVPLYGIFKYKDPLNQIENTTSIDNIFSFAPQKINLSTEEVLIMEDFLYYSKPLFDEKKILPFASDAGGYFLCFDYRENTKNPPVVLWIRDYPEGKDIAYIANNLEEFINNLKFEEETE